MSDPDSPEKKDELRKTGLFFFIVCTVVALVSGVCLLLTDHAWESKSLWWAGLFIGTLFSGFGIVMWWEAVFAPPLTPEQRHFHEIAKRMGYYDHS